MHRLVVALALLALPLAAPAKEFVAQPEDFHCLQSGVKPAGKNFFVFNANPKRLKKAVRIAERDKPHKHYPVGTILQFFPFEAMAKRGGGFNREGGGWEFFRLNVSAAGTTIKARGAADVVNQIANKSCQDCHAAAKKFDFVCEGHDEVAQLGLPDNIIRALQVDVRCNGAP
jgi:hypothetical protein